MKTYIHYKILPELNLILEYYGGKINLNDVINHKSLEIRDIDYNENYHFISDMRDAEFNIISQDFNEYLNFLNKNNKVIGQRKSAILTNTPNQVAITSLFKSKSKHFPVRFEIFSTLEGAFNWVNLSKDLHEAIKETIRNLKEY